MGDETEEGWGSNVKGAVCPPRSFGFYPEGQAMRINGNFKWSDTVHFYWGMVAELA